MKDADEVCASIYSAAPSYVSVCVCAYESGRNTYFCEFPMASRHSVSQSVDNTPLAQLVARFYWTFHQVMNLETVR